MTIKQILARKNILIRETAALTLLSLKNCEDARQWLRARLPYQAALLPRQVFLYAVRDVDKLKLELDALDKFPRRITAPEKNG